MLQPRLLHMNAVTGAVENVTFMHMPPERRAVIPVPIQVCFLWDACVRTQLKGASEAERRSTCSGPTCVSNPNAANVQVTGEDMSPGIKRGGWVNMVARTVKVQHGLHSCAVEGLHVYRQQQQRCRCQYDKRTCHACKGHF